MIFNDMKTFVRLQADTDAVDAPDATLEVYALQAFDDIRRRISSWVDRMVSDTLTTVDGMGSYSLTGGQFANANLEYVRSVHGPTSTLVHVPFSVFQRISQGSDQTTSEATYWSVNNGTLWLWPTPSAVASYTVWGYQKFTDWALAATEPDLPVELHRSILHYMLSQYYLNQEDLDMSQKYMQQYEASIARFIASSMRQDNALPRVLGGRAHGNAVLQYDDWVRRNTEGI